LITSTKLRYVEPAYYWDWLTTVSGSYHPGIHPGTLSLAIPPRVGATRSGDGFGHRWGRNGESCVRNSGHSCPDCWHTG